MTDQLTADVERWLAADVRTTWPGKSGDCCDADERADMARWFAAQVTAFDAWRAAERRNGANSTRTAQDTNQSAQSDVVSTLLEAATAAAQARTWPPPKPGTRATKHCTHWTDDGEACCMCGQIVPDEAWAMPWCHPTANRQENA